MAGDYVGDARCFVAVDLDPIDGLVMLSLPDPGWAAGGRDPFGSGHQVGAVAAVGGLAEVYFDRVGEAFREFIPVVLIVVIGDAIDRLGDFDSFGKPRGIAIVHGDASFCDESARLTPPPVKPRL